MPSLFWCRRYSGLNVDTPGPVLFVPSGLIALAYICLRGSPTVSENNHSYLYRILGQHTSVWGDSLGLLAEISAKCQVQGGLVFLRMCAAVRHPNRPGNSVAAV